MHKVQRFLTLNDLKLVCKLNLIQQYAEHKILFLCELTSKEPTSCAVQSVAL